MKNFKLTLNHAITYKTVQFVEHKCSVLNLFERGNAGGWLLVLTLPEGAYGMEIDKKKGGS